MTAIEADQKLNGENKKEAKGTGPKPKSSLVVRKTEHMALRGPRCWIWQTKSSTQLYKHGQRTKEKHV